MEASCPANTAQHSSALHCRVCFGGHPMSWLKEYQVFEARTCSSSG
jgi:hypothetical protein